MFEYLIVNWPMSIAAVIIVVCGLGAALVSEHLERKRKSKETNK